MHSSRILSGLSLAALIGLSLAATEYNPVRKQPAAAGANIEWVIVKLSAAGTSGRAQAQSASNAIAALAGRNNLTLKQTRQITSTLHVMQFEPEASGESLDESLARLRADSAVEYAEPDHRRYPHAVPDDPLYTGQWYMQNASTTPSAIDAEGAWDVTTGAAAVVIADIDTGVLFDHPDLLRAAAGGRLLPGYDFVSDTSTANDGDGRDSNPADPGDWITTAESNSSTFSGCSVSDSSWHGTRVAGIIGALTNNSTGIAGLTWSGSILPVRVLGKCGGYDSDILAAMLWAAGIHVDGVTDNPYPAKIENLSLGSTGTTCPATYQDVISQLTAAGVLVVASAGNEGGPVSVPARCDGVAAVAGLRHAGTKVGFSSLGAEIALSAPGGNCVNTGASDPCLYSIDTTYNLGTTTATTHSYTDQIDYNVGTSFSAPIVSGIAGLMVAVNGNLNSSELIARLQEGATTPFPVSSDSSVPQCRVPTSANDLQTSECNCTTQTCGAGMANANGAVQAALRPIAAVTTPASVSAGQSITLQGGGSAACNYTIASYAWTVVSGSVSIPDSNTDTATVVAPSSGSYTVRLTVTDNVGRQDTADVVVSSSAATTTAPATAGTNACASTGTSAITVSVSPASASIQAGDTQSFTATVTNSSNTAVTWQVNSVTGGNATVGTISTSGVYTAPASVPSPATVTVTAVSVADSDRSGSAQVTITLASSNSGGGGGGGGGAISLSTLIALAVVLMLGRRRREVTRRRMSRCA